jgi:hypothetical protein
VEAVALHDDGDVVFLQIFDVGLDVNLRFVIRQLTAQRGSRLRRLADAGVGVRHPAGGNRGTAPPACGRRHTGGIERRQQQARAHTRQAPRITSGVSAAPGGNRGLQPRAALVIPNIAVDKHINPVRTLRVEQIENIARRHPVGILIAKSNEFPKLGVVTRQPPELCRPIGRIAGVGGGAVVERHLDVVIRIHDQ